MASSSTIEIERKFTSSCVGALEDHLVSVGGKLIASIDIDDTYFDTPSLTLTKRDTWLRLRSGVWEVKIPLESSQGHGSRSGGETTVFQEISGEDEVKAELARSFISIEDPLASSLTGTFGLEPFAAFRTHRRKYKLGDVTVDVDTGSALSGIHGEGVSREGWNPTVIEIECICENSSEVGGAYDVIDAVASPFITAGVLAPMDTKTGGKLESYIRCYCPRHLDALVRSGILT